MREYAVIAALVCLLTSGVVTTANGGGNVEPDPRALVLKLRDMPTGFALKSGHYVSNARAARESNRPVSDYVRWGRINGYEAIFEKPVALSALLKGPIQVYSIANVYRTANGAKASFAESVGPGLRKRDPQGKLKRLSVGTRLGDQARLYTYTEKTGGFTVRIFYAYWRTGRFIASVLTGGIEGGIDSESAVDLAKRQQALIRRMR